MTSIIDFFSTLNWTIITLIGFDIPIKCDEWFFIHRVYKVHPLIISMQFFKLIEVFSANDIVVVTQILNTLTIATGRHRLFLLL